MDFYGFYTGTEFEAYKFLGTHFTDNRVIFRVYAPAATRVSLIGSFNHWQEQPMNRVFDGQFWETESYEAKEGDLYKFRIYKKDVSYIDHADPYAFSSELRPGTASVLHNMNKDLFHDEKWLKKRNPEIEVSYKFISGNVGESEEGIITLPLYMAMFL